MSVEELIVTLQDRGIELWRDGENVRFRAPTGALTPDLRASIKHHKSAILAYLANNADSSSLSERTSPHIIPDPDNRYTPFALTDMQMAYLLGRTSAWMLGKVAPYYYTEVDIDNLHPERLQNALNQVIQRHDMLRAVITHDGHQYIQEQTPFINIASEDIRSLLEQTQTERLETIRYELSHRVFDPHTWPSFDLRLSRLNDTRYRLHFGLDLLFCDAYSALIFTSELHMLYHNPEASLPITSFSFRDWACALKAFEASQTYQRSLTYWRQRLQTMPFAPDLPLNEETHTPTRFTRYRREIPADVWRAMKTQAARRRLTPSGFLLAAFAETLAAFGAGKRFLLNLTVFNRPSNYAGIEASIGDFTSTVLVEIDLTGSTFIERAQTIQRQIWQDLEHTIVPGTTVLRELSQVHNTPIIIPIVFSSGIYGEAISGDASQLFEQFGETVYSISQTPQVGLDHQVFEYEGALRYNWDVVAALFPPGYLDGLFAAYTQLLTTLATTPSAWEASLLPRLPVAQHALIAHANATAGPVPTSPLHAPLLEQADQQPHAPAVVTPTATTTYHDLVQQAGALATTFPSTLTPGTLVGVLLPHSPDHVVATLALLSAGAAYLPLEVTWPPARIAQVLTQAQVSYVLTTPTLCAQQSWPPSVTPLPVDPARLPPVVAPPAPPAVPLEAVAYVIFTSGSTGTPKGVTLSHRAAHNTLADINRRFGVTADDRVLGLSALSFDLSVYDIFGLLGVGGTVVLPDPAHQRDPAHWLACLAAQQVSIWNSAPALLEMLLTYAEAVPAQARKALASLRLVLLSGDWIPVTLPERLWRLAPQAVVHSLGGATEGAIWSIGYPVRAVEPSWRSIPYGQALTNQTMWVLDAAWGHCPVGVPGQLHIGGVGLAQGYWRDPMRTAERFVPEPWGVGTRLYQTGDQGCWRPDGTISFLGRLDQQVKVRGHRVELGEVAVRLAAVAGVAQAEAQVVEAGGQPRLVGYVVGRAGAQAVAAWQAALREVVPGYMVPSQVVVLSHWPVTPNGKLDRQALASMVQTPSDTSIVTVPPANDIERTIAATIARVLHLHSVDVTQNFFEMGANSLLLVQAQREMYEALGYEIPILDLFEYSTVRSLAKRVAQQPATDTAAEQGRTRADMRKRAFGGYRRTLTTKNSD